MGKNTAKPKNTDTDGASGRRTQLTALIGGFIAIVAVAVIVAVATGGGGTATGDLEQFRPVGVAGEALPDFGGDTANDPAVGSVAPEITGQSFDGSAVEIASGEPTLVVVLAHWCPHCQAEVPKLTDWAESLGVPFGLDVVAVSTSAGGDRPNWPPSAWLTREGFPFPTMADDEVQSAAAALGTTGFPFMVMLDADHTVLWRYSGSPPDGFIESLVDETMASLN
jgi:thiol-disulfide isomerase/thioredoxin